MHEKFLVAGATGLVGSALVRKLSRLSYDYIGISSKDVDLKNYKAAHDYISSVKPTCIINSAARVGGIRYNSEFPVDFLLDNLIIQNNLMQIAHNLNIDKFIFLGSSCIYPRESEQPIKEEYLMTGKLEETNSAYAIAKIAGVELVKSYRKQFGRAWISLMPTNIYGAFDNFNESTAHVIPSLISKYVNAKINNDPSVELWGTGRARREFLHSDDLAEAIIFCHNKYNGDNVLNIGFGFDIQITELAEKISQIVGYKGKTIFNNLYPDGTPRKLLDSTKINELGWYPKIDLSNGLKNTIEWYMNSVKKGDQS